MLTTARRRSHMNGHSNMGRPSIAAPAKKPRVEVDVDMGDLRVLSAILRGVDITQVSALKRVVEGERFFIHFKFENV